MSNEKPIRGELLTPKETAQRLRVGLKTVYNMATGNEIPPHYVRSCIRFDSADVDDYLFFSKFNGRKLILSNLDKKQLLERFQDQVAHAQQYVEKIINETRRQPIKQ